MQKLEIFQSLWEMELRNPGTAERPAEEAFRTPIPDCDEARIQRVPARSDCCQGRIASRDQIQIRVDFSAAAGLGRNFPRLVERRHVWVELEADEVRNPASD